MSVVAGTVCFEGEKMWVGLSDGREIGVPLAWFPRLARATPAEREGVTLSPFGIHREAQDEDVSVEGILARRVGIGGGSGARWRKVGASTHPTLAPPQRAAGSGRHAPYLAMSRSKISAAGRPPCSA